MLIEPLRKYIAAQLTRAGATWEQQQRAKVARDLLEGRAPKRSYRITEVADGVDDARFFRATTTLLTDEYLWSILPPSCFTVHGRALSFRMISRMAAAVEELLASEHRTSLFQMFRVLSNVEETVAHLNRLRRESPCLLHPIVLQFMDDYGDLSDPVAIHVVALMAMGMHVVGHSQ